MSNSDSEDYPVDCLPSHLRAIELPVLVKLNARQCEILERLLWAVLNCSDDEIYNCDDSVIEEIDTALRAAYLPGKGGQHA